MRKENVFPHLIYCELLWMYSCVCNCVKCGNCPMMISEMKMWRMWKMAQVVTVVTVVTYRSQTAKTGSWVIVIRCWEWSSSVDNFHPHTLQGWLGLSAMQGFTAWWRGISNSTKQIIESNVVQLLSMFCLSVYSYYLKGLSKFEKR